MLLEKQFKKVSGRLGIRAKPIRRRFYGEGSTSREEGRPQHEHDYNTPIIDCESLRCAARPRLGLQACNGFLQAALTPPQTHNAKLHPSPHLGPDPRTAAVQPALPNALPMMDTANPSQSRRAAEALPSPNCHRERRVCGRSAVLALCRMKPGRFCW